MRRFVVGVALCAVMWVGQSVRYQEPADAIAPERGVRVERFTAELPEGALAMAGVVRCWWCGPGSRMRAANRARYVVFLREGNAGTVALLCRRHAEMRSEPAALILDADALNPVDLGKRI